MSGTNTRTTKLFQQDVVEKISEPGRYGIVLRCWHDAEDIPPTPSEDPLMRPLAYGEVGVTFLSHSEEREILPESQFRLLDRALQPGDYCKRSLDDTQAGVVTNIHVKAKIAHAITAEKVDGWWTTNDLKDKADAEVGDYVTFDDWIGQIIEVFDESLIQTVGNQLVRLPELGSRLAIGESGNNLLPPPDGETPKSLLRKESDTGEDIVVDVKHTVYAVAWLALNQSLQPTISAKKSRPQQFWAEKDIQKLTLIRGRSDLELRVGDHVYFKDPNGRPSTHYRLEGDLSGSSITVQTCLVYETSTELDILWQDGHKESLKSIDVIPYLNPDEYDCWPGDHVIWKNEDDLRHAVVQSVNAAERTALVLLPETNMIELASLLELDAHGSSDQDANDFHSDTFGVRVGDFVFIHAPGTTNGLEEPRVPRIGEIEPWVREEPFKNDGFSGWRIVMHELGMRIAAKQSVDQIQEKPLRWPNLGDGTLSWCGEVTGLNIDGSIEVTHPDGSKGFYPLSRLTRLYDGIEQIQDTWDEGSDGNHDEEGTWGMDEVDEIRAPNSTHPPYLGSDEATGYIPVLDGDDYDAMEVDAPLWSPLISEEDELEVPTVPESAYLGLTEDPAIDIVEDNSAAPPDAIQQDDIMVHANWRRFEILSSAPPDHSFISSPPAEFSRSFLGRLNKEYRILRSSLPDSIVVRAYEDRTDLLRSLIIGPENTPYQDAPFVIDWMLDSNFPQSPPRGHFLSWTNGNGRVNPNLYEEGKVCLSILGTWNGDKNEVWSAARSSLLQALVSIQGLVLVKEPWFCEPAYDKLRGTNEGIINSRLYSEKAYVLSRGFVRRALELPPMGLELEITQLYHSEKRLQKVVTDAEQLIVKSKASQEVDPADYDLAVPRLSAGGIIALGRTLARLRTFLEDTR